MMQSLILSIGKTCPKCGCESLEECTPIGHQYNREGIFIYDKHFHCVAEYGMSFGLKRLKNGKIQIGYNGNEEHLNKRFGLKPMESFL